MKKFDNTNTGAVWRAVSQNDVEYFSGKLDVEGKAYSVAMFYNDKKGNKQAPDFRLVIDEPRKQGGHSAGAGTSPMGYDDEEEIPF